MKVTLRGARISAGYSAREVGNILGLTDDTIRNYESGKTKPKKMVIRNLCEIYGCDESDLLLNQEGGEK